jgi:hypothetical protein
LAETANLTGTRGDWILVEEATMHAPQAENVVQRERISWEEICARYPDEWVVLTELEWRDADEESDDLVSALVLGHAKKRVDSLRETRAIRERDHVMEFTARFTGRLVPEGFVSFRLLGL